MVVSFIVIYLQVLTLLLCAKFMVLIKESYKSKSFYKSHACSLCMLSLLYHAMLNINVVTKPMIVCVYIYMCVCVCTDHYYKDPFART